MGAFRIFNLVFLLICMPLVGCGVTDIDKDDEYAKMSKADILLRAKMAMNAQHYQEATKDLDAIEAHYPFSEDAKKAKLLSLYTSLKAGQYAIAETEAQYFIEMNPNHPKVDYAYFIKGLSAYYQSIGRLVRYLPINRDATDQNSNRRAFFAFSELVKKYPKSKYANNAYKRMVYLKNTLAKYELNTAIYYAKRSAWVAVINRANNIVENFDDTEHVKEALYLLSIAYNKLKMYQQSQDAIKILEHNHPGSIAKLKEIEYIKNT